MKWIGLAAAAAILLTTIANDAVAEEKRSSLVVKSCTICHNSERICNAIGRKNENDWQQTVTRMVGKGAPLDEEKARLVVDFLSGLTENTPPVCP
jgi:predicted secreted protein